jgi:hypothetical protein
LIVEIPDVLLAIDPVICGLWSLWREVLGAEAWKAVLRLTFIKEQLLTESQQH